MRVNRRCQVAAGGTPRLAGLGGRRVELPRLDGTAWNVARLPAFFSDAVFELADDGDPTRRAVFDLAAIAAGATRAFALPDVSTELAGCQSAGSTPIHCQQEGDGAGVSRSGV